MQSGTLVTLLLFSQLLLLVTAFVFVYAERHANHELSLFCQWFTLIVVCMTPLVPCVERIVVCSLSVQL